MHIAMRKVTFQRWLLEKLDRRGGRFALAKYASWHASRTAKTDVEVFFDGVWMHRVADCYWADSPSFAYHRNITSKWLRIAQQQDNFTRDLWFYLYQPALGNIIVDVGAGDGSDLPTFARSFGMGGRILAIEAHPTTYRLLDRMVHWSRLGNVTCINKAIVEHPCILHISDLDRHIGNTVTRNGAPAPGDAFVVQGASLRDVCHGAGVDRIDFLKMNIEGAERHAIHGMRELLPRTRYICIACHDFRAERGDGDSFRTKAIVIDFLRRYGFQIVLREAHADVSVRDHVHAWNPALVSTAEQDDSHGGELGP